MADQSPMDTLSSYFEEREELQASIKEMDEILSKKKSELRNLEENLIPSLMEEMNCYTFRDRNGRGFDLTFKYRGSIRADSRAKAFQWLEENGHGGLIKRGVSVEFNKDQEQAAVGLLHDLKGTYPHAEMSRKVHPSTFDAFVRECQSKGINLPDEFFSVYAQPKLKVTK